MFDIQLPLLQSHPVKMIIINMIVYFILVTIDAMMIGQSASGTLFGRKGKNAMQVPRNVWSISAGWVALLGLAGLDGHGHRHAQPEFPAGITGKDAGPVDQLGAQFGGFDGLGGELGG